MAILRFAIWRQSAILNFRGSLMVSLKAHVGLPIGRYIVADFPDATGAVAPNAMAQWVRRTQKKNALTENLNTCYKIVLSASK